MASDTVTRILVGYDYSPLAHLALRRGFDLAAKEEHGELHVVTVAFLNDEIGASVMGAAVPQPLVRTDDRERLLQRVTTAVGVWQQETGAKFDRVVTHVRYDAPALEIAQLAADIEAKMIIVGTHGRRGVERLLLGSVAEAVVRLAPCEVLVVRPPDTQAEVPKIEPPCPRCVETRRASGGERFWCDQHLERHGQRHTYHFEDRLSAETNITGPTSSRS
jgi:nucleotide-binding universal stress UspA family protein